MRPYPSFSSVPIGEAHTVLAFLLTIPKKALCLKLLPIPWTLQCTLTGLIDILETDPNAGFIRGRLKKNNPMF